MKKAIRRKKFRVIFLFIISIIFVGIAAATAILGINYTDNRKFKETFYTVSNLKVNNKVRIIQISDLHNCTYGDDNSELIHRVLKLKPDVIIYTGDIIDSNTASDAPVLNLCAELAKVAPSYYIYGNNEIEKYYDGVLTQYYLDEKFGIEDSARNSQSLLDVQDAFAQKLEAVGVRALKNSMETITVGSTNVDVYGVLTSNPAAFWSYAGDSFGQYLYTNENHLKVTAIHEPTVFEAYSPAYWGDLMLAGHTHGGLMHIPLVGPLYTPEGGLLPQRNGCYVIGQYDIQGSALIVSAGLENSNILRLNNQPELVIIDINKY